MQQLKYRIALAGNPNCGKTSIFNALTGSRQHVGNWPGKTVEQKSGFHIRDEIEFEIVDLPGTYSLTAYSLEEVIARDYIINENPDVVISVVDAANLERNLYLTIQILELGVPVILALNMWDIVESKGLQIDLERISQALKSPVVTTIASSNQGLEDLIDEVLRTVGGPE
ncbi:MAG: 50S ribosome-binding GTPase [Anaerolineaceae bacterium]|nr:50S ribosome-binding GTPase [Anaerolineaceae bacterium]